LRPSCDIAETPRHFGESLAWPDVIERARRWRWERGVYVALRLAKELVGAAVPEEVLREMRPEGCDDTMLSLARTQVLTSPSLSNAMGPALVTLWHMDGQMARLGTVVRRVLLSKAALSEMYGIPPDSSRLYFYYLVRLKDLVRRNGRMVLGLLQRDPMLTSIVARKGVLRRWLMEE